jgi:hypothetical protein
MRKIIIASMIGLTTLTFQARSFASSSPNSACVSFSQYAAAKFAVSTSSGCPKGYKAFDLGFPSSASAVSLLNDVAKNEFQYGFNAGSGAMRARCLGGWFPPAPGQQATPPTC